MENLLLLIFIGGRNQGLAFLFDFYAEMSILFINLIGGYH